VTHIRRITDPAVRPARNVPRVARRPLRRCGLLSTGSHCCRYISIIIPQTHRPKLPERARTFVYLSQPRRQAAPGVVWVFLEGPAGPAALLSSFSLPLTPPHPVYPPRNRHRVFAGGRQAPPFPKIRLGRIRPVCHRLACVAFPGMRVFRHRERTRGGEEGERGEEEGERDGAREGTLLMIHARTRGRL